MDHEHIYVATNIEVKYTKHEDVKEVELCDKYYCLRCAGIGIFRTYEFNIPLEEEYDFDEENYPCICDKDLANGIYKKLLENYPDIDKETLLKYLNASLYNIRTKQKSEKVLKKRIKRLGLYPNFSKWDKDSVIHY